MYNIILIVRRLIVESYKNIMLFYNKEKKSLFIYDRYIISLNSTKIELKILKIEN